MPRFFFCFIVVAIAFWNFEARAQSDIEKQVEENFRRMLERSISEREKYVENLTNIRGMLEDSWEPVESCEDQPWPYLVPGLTSEKIGQLYGNALQAFNAPISARLDEFSNDTASLEQSELFAAWSQMLNDALAEDEIESFSCLIEKQGHRLSHFAKTEKPGIGSAKAYDFWGRIELTDGRVFAVRFSLQCSVRIGTGRIKLDLACIDDIIDLRSGERQRFELSDLKIVLGDYGAAAEVMFGLVDILARGSAKLTMREILTHESYAINYVSTFR